MLTALLSDGLVLSPYVEFSKGELVWSIAAGPSPHISPNLLSELTFSEIQATKAGLNALLIRQMASDLYLVVEAGASAGKIASGEVRDSDYETDSRGGEFSRSYSKTKGDGSEKYYFGGGVKARWFHSKGNYFTVRGGVESASTELEISDGKQYLPESDRGMVLIGLDSSYRFQNKGLFAAVSTEHAIGRFAVGAEYKIADLELDATGNWNLREDFAHPTSFTQVADGKGQQIVISGTFFVNAVFDINLSIAHYRERYDKGYSQTYFSDGFSYVTTLLNHDYKETSMTAAVQYRF